jgi:hypothetical protein
VRVGVHCDADGGLPEPLTDRLGVHALSQEQGRMGVAQGPSTEDLRRLWLPGVPTA